MAIHTPAGAPPAIESASPLILDLLEWLAPGARPYEEVMEAWRTSCPRLSVWEDAVDAGLVARQWPGGGAAVVVATELGRRRLAQAGRPGGR